MRCQLHERRLWCCMMKITGGSDCCSLGLSSRGIQQHCVDPAPSQLIWLLHQNLTPRALQEQCGSRQQAVCVSGALDHGQWARGCCAPCGGARACFTSTARHGACSCACSQWALVCYRSKQPAYLHAGSGGSYSCQGRALSAQACSCRGLQQLEFARANAEPKRHVIKEAYNATAVTSLVDVCLCNPYCPSAHGPVMLS